MANIDRNQRPDDASPPMPDIYPRLAYDDEYAAVEYLGRVFQLREIRESRVEHGDTMMAWLRTGTGVIMVGRADQEVHRIGSPHSTGGTTVQMMVSVEDVDAHYSHAVSNGADVSMPIEDAAYGERRYEATDLEGHRWHFAEGFEHIRARGGAVAGAAFPKPEPSRVSSGIDTTREKP